MNATTTKTTTVKRLATGTAAAVLLLTLTACSHVMMMFGTGAKKPAESEFGLGPRTSAQARYVATLQPQDTLRVRKMQSVQVTIADASGKPVDGATISIDGGMPEHGHGLPTRPRVSKNLGNGAYQIDGVRFNMGGWWEFKLAINGPAGSDVVTFNIAL
jgi:hypothetical protein